MRALITGGAGFIGSNLAKQLVAGGNDVIVLDNLSSGFRANLDPFPEIRFIEGDIRDDAAVAKAIKGVEVVFHLAASVGNKRSIDHPLLDADINVMGTLKILEASRLEGVQKIVASSSAGIFGELKKLPIKEDHPVEPDTPYGSSKLCMEKECLCYAKIYEMEAVCLRYFNVYGPNQRFDAYGNVIPIFAFQMLRNEQLTIFGDGEQTRDFINVKDAVQANILAAMARGVSGAFNVGSGERITINSLVDLLREVSGIETQVVHGPTRPGDVRHSLADISAASHYFGFEPTVSMQEGIQEYMTWAASEIIK